MGDDLQSSDSTSYPYRRSGVEGNGIEPYSLSGAIRLAGGPDHQCQITFQFQLSRDNNNQSIDRRHVLLNLQILLFYHYEQDDDSLDIDKLSCHDH